MEIGQQVGPYKIESLLGQGGMAAVYKARHGGLGRYEALKVLPPHLAHDHDFVKRFLQEARIVAQLQHPHIAAIHTVSEPDCPQPYFAMDYVPDGDLSDLIERHGRFTLAEAVPILKQMADALDYAHAQGIIHRDMKPANVLLQSNGQGGWNVKVVDFGIASTQETGNTRLTKTGMIVGTPAYMSPEQAGSGAVLDYHTDIYALGIIAYEMLCGEPPFRAEAGASPLSVLMQHIRDVPRPPVEMTPGLPPAANQAILKALAKESSQRFASCAAFVTALEAKQPEREIKPPGSGGAAWRTPAIVGAAVLAGVALVGYGVLHSPANNGHETTTTVPGGAGNTASTSGGGEISSGLVAPATPTHTPPPTPTPKPAVPNLKGTWQGTWPWHKSTVPATLLINDQFGSSFEGVLTVAFASGDTRVQVSGSTGANHSLLLRETQVISEAPSGDPWGKPSIDPGVFTADWRSMSGHIGTLVNVRWAFHKSD